MLKAHRHFVPIGNRAYGSPFNLSLPSREACLNQHFTVTRDQRPFPVRFLCERLLVGRAEMQWWLIYIMTCCVMKYWNSLCICRLSIRYSLPHFSFVPFCHTFALLLLSHPLTSFFSPFALAWNILHCPQSLLSPSPYPNSTSPVRFPVPRCRVNDKSTIPHCVALREPPLFFLHI